MDRRGFLKMLGIGAATTAAGDGKKPPVFTCKSCAKHVERHPIAGPGRREPCWRCGEMIEPYQGAGIVPPEKQAAPSTEAPEASATPKR